MGSAKSLPNTDLSSALLFSESARLDPRAYLQDPASPWWISNDFNGCFSFNDVKHDMFCTCFSHFFGGEPADPSHQSTEQLEGYKNYQHPVSPGDQIEKTHDKACETAHEARFTALEAETWEHGEIHRNPQTKWSF